MTEGYFSPAEVDRLGRAMPHGIVRFTESGKLADWREDILGWMVTGSERVWGDPLELVRMFGPYEALAVVSPTPPTDEETRNAIYKVVHDAIEATTVDKKLELVDRYTIALEVTRQLFDSGLRAGFVAGNQEQEK